MNNPLYQQYLKTASLQTLIGFIAVVSLKLTTFFPYKAGFFSVLTGIVYTLLLVFSTAISNWLSQSSTHISVMALSFFALVRFLIIALMLIYGMSQWGEYPIALILPFGFMILSPLFFSAKKKRLTD